MTPICYRQFLKEELQAFPDRHGTPMSIRKLASNIKLSASYISQVLNEKKQLTEDKAYGIAQCLKLDRKKTSLFVNLVRLERSTSEQGRQEILAEIDIPETMRIKYLQTDTFRVLSKWYYGAILELTDLPVQKQDLSWIAKQLQVARLEVELSFDRLERMGLLQLTDGRYVKTSKHFVVKNIPSEAVRQFHAQCLDQAAKSLKKDSYEKRNFTGTTIAVDSGKLDEIRNLIDGFCSQMMKFAADTRQDSVYHLGIQFFPVFSI